jgi:hypothetical protein
MAILPGKKEVNTTGIIDKIIENFTNREKLFVLFSLIIMNIKGLFIKSRDRI